MVLNKKALGALIVIAGIVSTALGLNEYKIVDLGALASILAVVGTLVAGLLPQPVTSKAAPLEVPKK